MATPLAWWLAAGRSAVCNAVQALVALPLVLPPTVLGFYLLVALDPRGAIGSALGANAMDRFLTVVLPLTRGG